MSAAKGGILALDLGLGLGWAVLTPGGAVFSGCHRIQPHDEGGYGLRFRQARDFLEPAFRLWPASSVLAYERVQGGMKNDDAATTQVGMRCGVMELASVFGWEKPLSIVPQSLKKWATGKGTATKPDMVAAARAWWKCGEIGHNEADALLVLAWAMRNGKLAAAHPARTGLRGGIEFGEGE